MSIADAIKSLKKEIAHAFDLGETVKGMSTGSLAIDIITGIGGFPRGRVSEVFGWESSGKTTLCLMACAAAQRRGEYWVYIDFERGVDRILASKLGLDLDDTAKGLFLTPDTFEEGATIIEKMAATGEVAIIVGDSVPGMVPKTVLEGDIDATGRIGEMARLLASTLPRLTKTVAQSGTALVFVNQMRQKVNTGWSPSWAPRESREETAGGSALRFFSSLRVELRLLKKGEHKKDIRDLFTGKDVAVPITNLHEGQAFKNKVASPYRKCTFTIRYDADRDVWGIDHRQTVLDIALSQGLLAKKPGGRFVWAAGSLDIPVQGEEALYDFLLANPDVDQTMQAAVIDLDVVKQSIRR